MSKYHFDLMNDVFYSQLVFTPDKSDDDGVIQ